MISSRKANRSKEENTLSKTLAPSLASSRALAIDVARAASSKKAADVRILDVASLIEITDYFVVCSGASERQVRTIVQEIEGALAPRKPLRREGERERTWVVLDYGDVVVHVFAQQERDYYEIERVWRDAEQVPFEEGPAAAARS